MLELAPTVLSHAGHANGRVRRSPATLGRKCAEMAQDPIRLAELIQRAAEAARRGAPGPQKQYANALGISTSRASRHLNGDDPYSPCVRLLSVVEALASGDYTSAVPLLLEAYGVAMEALNRRSTEDLEARLRELQRRRVEAQATLDRARLEEYARAVNYGAAAVDNAMLAVAELDVELVAIRRILRERAVAR